MEEIATELSILKKSFPFIKFTFTKPYKFIRIWINKQDTTNEDDFLFWYESDTWQWEIHTLLTTNIFNEFLEQFIEGLIYWELY